MCLMKNVFVVLTTVKPVIVLELVLPTNVTIRAPSVMVSHVIIALPVPLDITKRKNLGIGEEILLVHEDVHTVTIFWENTVFPVILHARNVRDLQKISVNLAIMEKNSFMIVTLILVLVEIVRNEILRILFLPFSNKKLIFLQSSLLS